MVGLLPTLRPGIDHAIVYSHFFDLNNIIYTPLCTIQQIYYIHNVVQMQLLCIIYTTLFTKNS